ncbi:hypothetical protein ACFQPG_12115 [Sphingomonas sp. GCM10030256]|uniref:hypothetical protein n=1 Tax=Sphingomonas sp. GCM10030256 TaxID=3273427 RepID=UPI003619792D
MSWTSIRLELGETGEFPNGSASRAYLLRLPLADDGTLDARALESAPEQATVRRLWPSEPDISGQIVAAGDKWVIMAGRSGRNRCPFSEIDPRPISEGALLTLREKGRKLLFRVAKLRPLS